MSTMVVYQNILKKDEDLELLVFHFKSYEHDLYVQEAYCSNPNCDCFEAQLSFYNIINNQAHKQLFNIRYDLRKAEILDQEILDRQVNVKGILDEFKTDLEVLTPSLVKHYERVKDFYHIHVPEHKNAYLNQLMNQNATVGYGEVFEQTPLTYMYKLDNYLLMDSYCINPKCDCHDVNLMFTQIGKTKEFTIQLNLKTKQIEWLMGSEEPEIVKDFIQHESMIEELKSRYQKMKQAGSQIKKSQVSMPVQSKDKVGRNEPCPCGSGKKYKHCCGR
jgi:uncharacterized protein YchJ